MRSERECAEEKRTSRGQGEDDGEDVDKNPDIKKPRLDIKPIAAGEAAKLSSIDGPVFETKPRLFVENVSVKEAFSYYELLSRRERPAEPEQDRAAESGTPRK